MTPFVLLLTSAEEVGGPILIPIPSIDFAVPLGEVTRIFLHSSQFIDVTENFDSIVRVMGGLVMRPNTNLGTAWPVAR
jgi:hypothetical protein